MLQVFHAHSFPLETNAAEKFAAFFQAIPSVLAQPVGLGDPHTAAAQHFIRLLAALEQIISHHPQGKNIFQARLLADEQEQSYPSIPFAPQVLSRWPSQDDAKCQQACQSNMEHGICTTHVA